MSGSDWLLALHLVSAVALGAAMTGFWVLTLATRPTAAPIPTVAAGRISLPLTVAVSVGTLGTVVFGVWLAIVDEAYRPWDGWILAAIVLWALGTGLGQRGGKLLQAGQEARGRGIALQAASTVAILAVLVLMVWKPGA